MKIFALLLLVLSLACGGGGGSSSSTTTPAGPQNLEGVWVGSVHSNYAGRNYLAFALISDTNRVLYAAENGIMADAQLSMTTTTGSASGTIFASPSSTLPNGSLRDFLTITVNSGTTKGSISGVFSGGGDSGTFSFTYSAAGSETPINFAATAGTYKADYYPPNALTTWPVLDTTGSFSYLPSGNWASTDWGLMSGLMGTKTARPGLVYISLGAISTTSATPYRGVTGMAYHSGSYFYVIVSDGFYCWTGNMVKQ